MATACVNVKQEQPQRVPIQGRRGCRRQRRPRPVGASPVPRGVRRRVRPSRALRAADHSMPSPAVASQSRSSSWTADISASARVALRSASNAACRSAWSDSSSRRAAMEMPRWRACAASLSRVGIGTRIVVVCVATNYILDHLLLWRFRKLRRFSGLSPDLGVGEWVAWVRLRVRIATLTIRGGLRVGTTGGGGGGVGGAGTAGDWCCGRLARLGAAAAGCLGSAAAPVWAGPAPPPALWSRCRRWVTWAATAAPATSFGCCDGGSGFSGHHCPVSSGRAGSWGA